MLKRIKIREKLRAKAQTLFFYLHLTFNLITPKNGNMQYNSTTILLTFKLAIFQVIFIYSLSDRPYAPIYDV